MEIIVKKMQRLKSGIFGQMMMGDVRSQMAYETLNICEKIINDYYGKKDEMYILIYGNPLPGDRRVIHTKIMIVDRRPPKLLGTICFYVDYRISDVDLLWVLPLDIMRLAETVGEKASFRIDEDAKGLPIFN